MALFFCPVECGGRAQVCGNPADRKYVRFGRSSGKPAGMGANIPFESCVSRSRDLTSIECAMTPVMAPFLHRARGLSDRHFLARRGGSREGIKHLNHTDDFLAGCDHFLSWIADAFDKMGVGVGDGQAAVLCAEFDALDDIFAAIDLRKAVGCRYSVFLQPSAYSLIETGLPAVASRSIIRATVMPRR